MATVSKQGCRINRCGKPLAPLEGDRALQEEDDFRACTEHKKELLAAFWKLRGNE